MRLGQDIGETWSEHCPAFGEQLAERQFSIKKAGKKGLGCPKIKTNDGFALFVYFIVFPTSKAIFAVQFLKPIAMYAVVDIAGKQFKVEKDQYLYAPLMDAEAGATVKFDKVLLIDSDGSVQVGSPLIKGASISGKVVEHVKDGKVIVFKKKRRKGYALKNGHRQKFTKVQIDSIQAK
jgi:large subunit ribosomal protein L21